MGQPVRKLKRNATNCKGVSAETYNASNRSAFSCVAASMQVKVRGGFWALSTGVLERTSLCSVETGVTCSSAANWPFVSASCVCLMGEGLTPFTITLLVHGVDAGKVKFHRSEFLTVFSWLRRNDLHSFLKLASLLTPTTHLGSHFHDNFRHKFKTLDQPRGWYSKLENLNYPSVILHHTQEHFTFTFTFTNNRGQYCGGRSHLSDW